MLLKNKTSLFVGAFLIIGFFFLALPEKVGAQPPTSAPFAGSIPTLDVWGIIVLTGVLVMFGVFAIRRRKAKT